MTPEETKTMLIAIAAAYPNAKQPKEAVQIWHDIFKTKDAKVVMEALRQHISTNAWEPKISELLKEVEKKTLPPTLLMTPAEAYAQPMNSKLLLVVEARRFAAKAVPFSGGQFESPEALATATRIHNNRLEKEFKQRFETLQNQAKAKVHLGVNPKDAIMSVCPEATLLIKGDTSPKVSGLVGNVCDTLATLKKSNRSQS